MPYFVRAYREYLAAGATGSILLFPNVWPAQTRPTLDGAAPHACSREQVPVFRKANSILFSPACASKRYAGIAQTAPTGAE